MRGIHSGSAAMRAAQLLFNRLDGNYEEGPVVFTPKLVVRERAPC